MEAKFSYAVVGFFVLVLGAVLIGGVLWVSSGRYYGKSYVPYRTYMTDSVAGLNLNAPVKYHGVDVGFVRRIALNPANTEQVELTLAILHGTPVKDDTVAIMETQGLTGIAYVELTGGSKDAPLLTPQRGEDVPVIKSGPSLLTRFETAIYGALAGLTRATDTFNALLSDDNRRAFAETLADLRTVSRTLAKRSSSIDASLAGAERTMKSAERTMSNTAAFTGDLPRLVQRIERSADALDRMADAVARAGSTATTTLEDSRAELQRFTGEGLPEARALIGEMRETTATLRRLADELERNPDILVRGRPVTRRGPGE
jgi:phospholipid/cholesterol/gamma-HCH transport system substrate-binding protein